MKLNKRKFLQTLGLGCVGLAIPATLSSEPENEEEGDWNDPEEIYSTEFKVLEGSPEPAFLTFSNGHTAPFLVHPRNLLVCMTEQANGEAYVTWRPIEGTISAHHLEEISNLVTTVFTRNEPEGGDFDLDSGPEALDEEWIAKNRLTT